MPSPHTHTQNHTHYQQHTPLSTHTANTHAYTHNHYTANQSLHNHDKHPIHNPHYSPPPQISSTYYPANNHLPLPATPIYPPHS